MFRVKQIDWTKVSGTTNRPVPSVLWLNFLSCLLLYFKMTRQRKNDARHFPAIHHPNFASRFFMCQQLTNLLKSSRQLPMWSTGPTMLETFDLGSKPQLGVTSQTEVRAPPGLLYLCPPPSWVAGSPISAIARSMPLLPADQRDWCSCTWARPCWLRWGSQERWPSAAGQSSCMLAIGLQVPESMGIDCESKVYEVGTTHCLLWLLECRCAWYRWWEVLIHSYLQFFFAELEWIQSRTSTLRRMSCPFFLLFFSH